MLIAGLFLGSAAAAVIVWAAIGGSGEGRRAAALIEPTGHGSIGVLSIEGVRGGTAMPVRSFNWHPIASYNFQIIEVLRDGGEHSPEIFNFSASGTTSAAFLDLVAPGASGPYLRYQLSNARSVLYGGGKYEKIALKGLSSQVTDGRNPAPEPEPSDIVGYMTLGDARVRILAFDSGFELTGSPPFDHAVIRRPLDELTPMLNEDFLASTTLGTVTIELHAARAGTPPDI